MRVEIPATQRNGARNFISQSSLRETVMDAGHSSHFDIVNRQTRLHLVFSFVLAKLPSRFLVGTADVWMARRQRALPVSGRLTPDHFWPRSTNMAASAIAYRGGSLGLWFFFFGQSKIRLDKEVRRRRPVLLTRTVHNGGCHESVRSRTVDIRYRFNLAE